ncbi:hypothetical protein BTA51_01050 [Hahella sp. CCB-MM4]|nr:hypothetical protein BTA51_01050 [Hahella sp. CCB-MM4]
MALKFLENEPVAAARQLELEDPDSVCAFFQKVSQRTLIPVLRTMLPAYAAPVITQLPEDFTGNLFSEMNQADIAAILRHTDSDNCERLLKLLPIRKQTACKLLVSFPEYTIGAWLETGLLVLDEHMEVQEALTRLKKKAYSETQDIYVVNRKRHVRGKISVYDLIRAAPTQPVNNLVRDSGPSLSGLTHVNTALSLPIWNQQDTVAVVNRKQEFLGVLHHFSVRTALSRMEEPTVPAQTSVSGDLMSAYTGAVLAIIDAAFRSPEPQEPQYRPTETQRKHDSTPSPRHR